MEALELGNAENELPSILLAAGLPGFRHARDPSTVV